MAAIILGQGQSRFALQVTRYQFPLIQAGSDSNWLMVEMKVDSPEGSWSCVDPMLETRDLPLIAEWLEAVADGQQVKNLWFTEPNLRFTLAEGAVRVYFEQEALAPWHPRGFEGAFLDLQVSPAELRQAAQAMRAMAAQWPVRGVN